MLLVLAENLRYSGEVQAGLAGYVARRESGRLGIVKRLAPSLAERFELVLRLLEISLCPPYGFPCFGLWIARHRRGPYWAWEMRPG
jgi:hypothetical protein